MKEEYVHTCIKFYQISHFNVDKTVAAAIHVEPF